MSADEQFEQALRDTYTRSPRLLPSADQWEIIASRRARGDRVVIPEPRVSWSHPWLASAATVALIGLGLSLAPFIARSKPAAPAALGSGIGLLSPGLLLAQTTTDPAYSRVVASTRRGLRAGSWTYTDEGPSNMRPWDRQLTYALRQSTHEGREAWLVLAGEVVPGKAPVFHDSTWLSRDGLTPLAHHGDTTGAEPIAADFFTVLQAADLSATWTGSVPLLESVRDSVVVRRWLNLRVYGSETIDVPAGRYDCWKVGFTPNIGFFFWVSKDGWPVRQGMSRLSDRAIDKLNLSLVRHDEP